MSKFLTYKTEIIQSEENFKWITLHNQLFINSNNKISLVPRNFITDGYTILNIFAPIIGNRMELDIRPAIQHDFNCKYRLNINVRLSEKELRQKGYLRHIIKDFGSEKLLINVCEDIPLKYLSIEKIDFKNTNKNFKEMLFSICNISNIKKNLLATGVYLNIGWIKDKPKILNINNIYKDLI